MSSVKKRNASLDLLRILSMLLIIFLHSIDHSGVLEQAEVSSGTMYFYVRFAYGLCMVCVNCYVMISGYYLVTSKFRLQKLAVLWMEAAFYSLVLKLLFMVTGQEAFSLLSLVSCFFPILTGRYWFLTIYVGMYLVSPFLNKLIRAMNRRDHTVLNLCLFLLFSLWSSIHPSIAGMNSGGGWGLAWFAVLYLAAAWFRLYYTPGHRPVILIGMYLLIPLLMTVGQVAANAVGIGVLQSIIGNWFRYDSAPVYLMTLSLFAAFLNVRLPRTRVAEAICSVAPLTLGVYLIHAHANVSPWLWELLNLPAKMSLAWFPLIQLGCVIAIFVMCIAIDALRKATVGRLERSRLIHTVCSGITSCINTLIHSIPAGDET